MNRRLRILLLGMAVLVVTAVGCGGGDDTLTKAEFIEQADVICAEGQAERVTAARPLFRQTPTEAELVKLVNDTGIPSLEAELEEIRDLNPPSEDEAEVEAVLEAFEKRVQKAEAKPLLLVRGLEFDEYHDKTGAYGFKVCGQR